MAKNKDYEEKTCSKSAMILYLVGTFSLSGSNGLLLLLLLERVVELQRGVGTTGHVSCERGLALTLGPPAFLVDAQRAGTASQRHLAAWVGALAPDV